MKKYLFAFLAVASLSATFASADFNLKDWQFQKPIMVPPGSVGYVKVPLDNQILAGAQREQSDLRVIDSSGTEINYQLVRNNGVVSRADYAATMLDLVNDGTAPTFILDLGKSGIVHDSIDLKAVWENYKRQVSIYGANSLLSLQSPEWQNLTTSGYIYGYYDKKANFQASDGKVPYPPATFRYLKVMIASGDGTVKVSSATVRRTNEEKAVTSIMTPAFKVTENATDRTTEITIDLGQSGIATSKLTLGLNGRTQQFSRAARVSVSPDNVRWSEISNGYIFNLQTPKFVGTNLDLTYPETRERYLRVTVMNDDNQPVKFSGVAVLQTESDLVFSVTAGQSYILYYGNPSAHTPSYELARYFQYLDTADMNEATFGPEAANLAYVPKIAPFTERHPYLLNSILALMVVVALGLVGLYMKKLQKK